MAEAFEVLVPSNFGVIGEAFVGKVAGEYESYRAPLPQS
jgi:hypothetical protein